MASGGDALEEAFGFLADDGVFSRVPQQAFLCFRWGAGDSVHKLAHTLPLSW